MTPNSVSISPGSIDDVGSSMITTRGPAEAARARATICWVPAGSEATGRRTSARTPYRARISSASACIRAKSMSPRRPRGSLPRKMLRATLIWGARLPFW